MKNEKFKIPLSRRMGRMKIQDAFIRKRIAALLVCILHFSFFIAHSEVRAEGRGIPFFRNFSSKEYMAHNRNYDIACDEYGTVFVANFEGLLYYDGATWRKIHTPGISRVTRLARGENGRIWVGGYNVFGYLKPDRQGRIQLQTIVSDADKGALSEVDFIKVTKGNVFVHTTAGKSYEVVDDKTLKETKHDGESFFSAGVDSVRRLKMPFDVQLQYSHNSGLDFGNSTYSFAPLSEADGLISNAINHVSFTLNHLLWGATDNGIFAIEAPSPYGQIGDKEGLKGEVNCIGQLAGTYYIGTMQGLYRLRGNSIRMVDDIDLACWQLVGVDENKMLAATSDGLYLITPNQVQRITTDNTFSVCQDKERGGYVTGEVDGVYYVSTSGNRQQISPLEKVTKIQYAKNKFTVESIYGELWEIKLSGNATSVKSSDRCIRQSADVKAPRLSYTDMFGTLWQTDTEGRNLRATSTQNSKLSTLNTKLSTLNTQHLTPWMYPFTKRALNCLYVGNDGKVWVGGDFGAIVLDTRMVKDIEQHPCARPCIRQVVAMGDSVMWGGYSPNDMKPRYDVEGIELPSSCNQLYVTFSTMYSSIICPTEYRYRINGGRWSLWSTHNEVEINNLDYGSSHIDVQARDIFGRVSEISSMHWSVATPFYLQWWAFVIYLVIVVAIVYNLMLWRTRRLNAEKTKLESIVAKRTAELETSNSQLSATLDDLKRTQDNLVRMERTATAGKLTQGLIDRILNPINYINNFSKLTSGLAKDLMADIEDEKENISKENYEDCADIIDMMKTNLRKIEEHGISTTRTLRAMEAMLNSHIGTKAEHDLIALCRQTVAVTRDYHKSAIAESGIRIVCDMPDEPLLLAIDAASMKNALIAMLNNSIYSVTKKAKTKPQGYKPEIVVGLSKEGNGITIRDNGMGIEETIIDKVFDPFFTTKPTGEAAGVGLYLVRNTINDHNGKISVESQKDEYCQFTITL